MNDTGHLNVTQRDRYFNWMKTQICITLNKLLIKPYKKFHLYHGKLTYAHLQREYNTDKSLLYYYKHLPTLHFWWLNKTIQKRFGPLNLSGLENIYK
jgi:hypothetical protein